MSNENSIIIIKVGTNVITNSDGYLDTNALDSIVDQICFQKEQGNHIILVSSGAMAAGRAQLSTKQDIQKVEKRQVLAAVGQASLIEEYRKRFATKDLHCAQVLTTKEDFRTREHYVNMQRCFEALLEDSVIPIVNENDVVSVAELMFTDNDELAGMIASMINTDHVIILTSVDGVYNAEKNVISDIQPGDGSWQHAIKSEKSDFGKGGMQTKCSIAEKLASTGIRVHIVNGNTKNSINDAVSMQKIGTYFVPSKKASTVKRWIAHSEGNEKGAVTINNCAVDIMRSDAVTSLLPVGITSVKEEFQKGDVIQIFSESGEKIGIGKAQYDSSETKTVLLKQGEKALVHYDYLYIF